MKKILLCTIAISSLLFSQDTNNSETREDRVKKQIELEMKKEQKYAVEQTFYNYENYNFKGSEVNEESLKHVPNLELDELDMDSVYD